MAYDGLSGKYGNIPDDVWLKKSEMTDVTQLYPQNNLKGYMSDAESGQWEIEQHMRNMLVDHRPDRPFLESDQPRGSNIPGSGFMSEQMINLRTEGALTTTSPYLPDGTFLDHEFMERDPRSTATGPDMRKYVEQERARGSFFRYSPDDDWSVPESGINPVKMVANKNALFYPSKDRMQWFEESFDAWHNGGTVNRPRVGGNDKGKTTFDGTIVDLTEATYANRQDAISKLSNDPLMAYRYAVPDQRVKIARYGLNRISQSLNTQDWRANRAAAYISQDIGKVAENERVNTELATAIINLQRIHDTRQEVFKGADYGDSAVVQNLQGKVPTEVLNKILYYGQATQTDPAQMKFENSYIQRESRRRPEIRQEMGKSDYNHIMIESMQNINKLGRNPKSDDLRQLRDDIEQSASDQGIYLEVSQRDKVERFDRLKSLLNQIDGRHIEASREIANYKMAPIKEENKMKKVDFEAYQTNSTGNIHREGRATRDLVQNVKKYGEAPLYDEFGHNTNHTTGKTKNKERVRDHYDHTIEESKIVDLGSFN